MQIKMLKHEEEQHSKNEKQNLSMNKVSQNHSKILAS